MGYDYQTDKELEASTNRVMQWGVVLMLLMALVFPFYRWFEPATRADAREEQLSSLVVQGESIWDLNCSACHGVNGEGGIGPALNSQQFMQSATDTQITGLIAVGVPGTQMSAWSQDFGGPLTTEQIKAVVTFIRAWEPDAPDNPNWRDTTG
jgi:mono/diheme cytochrome c family protein